MTEDVFIPWSTQQGTPTLDMASARGAEYILKNGNVVLDFLSTSFQASFGHSHDVISGLIESQLKEHKVAFARARTKLLSRVTSRLQKYLNLGPGKVFYTVSGAEANENAAKIVRQIKKAPLILARQKSYHGATLGAISLTGDWRNGQVQTVDEWTLRIPEPEEDMDLKKTRALIEEAGPDNIAGLILETISGANGVVIPPQDWWQGIESLCSEYGIFLILDEVLCGFGRTGPAFAFHKFGLKPDLVTLSKGITGGYVPMGALWTSPKIAGYYDNNILACGLTAYAHPLGLAATDGVLDTLTDAKFLESKEQLEQHFSAEMEDMKSTPGITGCRHAGLLGALDLDEGVSVSWMDFIEQGVHLMVNSHLQKLILAPPFVMTREQLNKGFAGIKRVLESVV